MPSRNRIINPAKPTQVAASILSADFAKLGDECRSALDAGADLLHLDVMDGHFVPNLTMGPALTSSLRKALPDVCLDAHLMVNEPAKFIRPFAEAGTDHFTFHVEVVDDPAAVAKQVHEAGMTAGLAINPPTDVERILPYVNDPNIDLILIMSVNPGFAGQSFMTGVLSKAKRMKPMLRWDQRLQIDGGVNAKTAAACREAGCDVLVAASAIFGTSDYAAAIATLRGEVVTKHAAR